MTVAALPGERIRLHQPLGGALVRSAPLLIVTGLNLWTYWDSPPPHRWSFVAACVALWAAWLGTECYPGITLTATHAVVHNFRPRRIAWTDVRAVTQERRSRGVAIVLWTTDGRRVVLRAPIKDWGVRLVRFERDFIAIGQWWLTHRAGA